MKRKVCMLLFALLLSTFAFGIEDEYYRKAALFKVFSQYIEWPENVGFSDLQQPFVIGVIGGNPFGNILELAFSRAENRIKGKKVNVVYISNLMDIEKCHILFVSQTLNRKLEDILEKTRSKPILTIAESIGYADRGVLFNITISGDALRFEVNVRALKESGLVVDSRLLTLANFVNPPVPRND